MYYPIHGNSKSLDHVVNFGLKILAHAALSYYICWLPSTQGLPVEDGLGRSIFIFPSYGTPPFIQFLTLSLHNAYSYY